MAGSTCPADDRAMSTAITHVLTMAITALLLVGLLSGTGSLLDSQTDRSAEGSLETIGERVAGEVAHADRLGVDGAGGAGVDGATIRVDHPRMVANSPYTIELRDGGCTDVGPLIVDDDLPCLVLETVDGSVTTVVSTADTHASVNESTVSGGAFSIVVEDDELRLEEGSR